MADRDTEDTRRDKIVRKDEFKPLLTKPMSPLKKETKEALIEMRATRPSDRHSSVPAGIGTVFHVSPTNHFQLGLMRYVVFENGQRSAAYHRFTAFEPKVRVAAGYAAACVLDDPYIRRTIGEAAISAAEASPATIRASVVCIPGALILDLNAGDPAPRGASQAAVIKHILSRFHVFIETGLSHHERFCVYEEASKLGAGLFEMVSGDEMTGRFPNPHSDWSDAYARQSSSFSLELHTDVG